MVTFRRIAIISGFAVFCLLYLKLASFPGPNHKSYVLLPGLLLSLGVGLYCRWSSEEILVAGLVFAVPMSDQLMFFRTLESRMLEDLLIYLAVPLCLFWLAKGGIYFRAIGLSLGIGRKTARTTALLLTLALLASLVGLFVPGMRGYYPIWDNGGTVTVGDFVYYELIFTGIMLAGEFFFRGLVLFTFAKKSKWGAIVFQSIPYAYLHLGKPSIEVPYALVAGIIFGWANYRSKSIIPSWITHSVGSALFDALVLIS